MALYVSTTDLAIALAVNSNTLELVERPSRLGGTYVAICDEVGIIEAALDMAEAEARVAAVVGRVEA